jgi:hypothetical protein
LDKTHPLLRLIGENKTVGGLCPRKNVDDDYHLNLKITAKREIKLILDFNSCLTKDEEQRQFLLQVLSEYRQIFSDSSQSTLAKLISPS